MIKEHLRYRFHFILFYFIIVFFFSIIHYLYGHPMGSMGYSLLIFTFFFVLWLFIDWLRFRDKMKHLDKIIEYMSISSHEIPESRNLIEEKYEELIKKLYQLIDSSKNSLEVNYTEQIEYYTMWVHQIKTPIAAMRLALQSNEETSESRLIDQELFKIEQYVELALQYVKISRISSDLVIQEYSLNDIVKSSVKKYAPLFIYKRISANIEDLENTVLTDSKWLSFILEQILSNSIKYTNTGGIHIYWKEGSLYITDTGIGIRSEDIPRIFEKGYTGYNGRIDKKSSGIGLYLVKMVADELAIKISIDSTVLKGTTVCLTFPIRDKNAYE